MGVHSLSDGTTIKFGNFRLRDRDFERAARHSDWKFVFAPVSQTAPTPVPKPPGMQ